MLPWFSVALAFWVAGCAAVGASSCDWRLDKTQYILRTYEWQNKYMTIYKNSKSLFGLIFRDLSFQSPLNPFPVTNSIVNYQFTCSDNQTNVDPIVKPISWMSERKVSCDDLFIFNEWIDLLYYERYVAPMFRGNNVTNCTKLTYDHTTEAFYRHYYFDGKRPVKLFCQSCADVSWNIDMKNTFYHCDVNDFIRIVEKNITISESTDCRQLKETLSLYADLGQVSFRKTNPPKNVSENVWMSYITKNSNALENLTFKLSRPAAFENYIEHSYVNKILSHGDDYLYISPLQTFWLAEEDKEFVSQMQNIISGIYYCVSGTAKAEVYHVFHYMKCDKTVTFSVVGDNFYKPLYDKNKRPLNLQYSVVWEQWEQLSDTLADRKSRRGVITVRKINHRVHCCFGADDLGRNVQSINSLLDSTVFYDTGIPLYSSFVQYDMVNDFIDVITEGLPSILSGVAFVKFEQGCLPCPIPDRLHRTIDEDGIKVVAKYKMKENLILVCEKNVSDSEYLWYIDKNNKTFNVCRSNSRSYVMFNKLHIHSAQAGDQKKYICAKENKIVKEVTLRMESSYWISEFWLVVCTSIVGALLFFALLLWCHIIPDCCIKSSGIGIVAGMALDMAREAEAIKKDEAKAQGLEKTKLFVARKLAKNKQVVV